MIGRVVCGLNGHEWTAWQPQSDMPTKARECARCRRRETLWMNTSGYRRSTGVPRIEFETDRPTKTQRSWAALSTAAGVAVGWLQACARIVAAWLAAARVTWTAHWSYAKYVARHKTFVYQAGRKLKAPWWRLVIHDYSKLTPAEWGPYVRTFYRPDILKSDKEAEFDLAWLHHQRHNPHHWQHHIHITVENCCQFPRGCQQLLPEDDGGLVCLTCGRRDLVADYEVREMPEPLVREMVADWAGAGRAITGRWGARRWYKAGAGAKMQLHPATRELVERLLTEESPYEP